MSHEGAQWWSQQMAAYAWGRFVVGLCEIICAIGLWSMNLRRYFALLIMLLMLGACLTHLPQGYSFKANGFETPLTYFFISLYFVLAQVKHETKTYHS